MSYVFLKGAPYKDMSKSNYKDENGKKIYHLPFTHFSFDQKTRKFKGSYVPSIPDGDGDIREDIELTFDNKFTKITSDIATITHKSSNTRF